MTSQGAGEKAMVRGPRTDTQKNDASIRENEANILTYDSA
jgi:hypothetical protein